MHGIDARLVRAAGDIEIATHPDETYDVVVIGGPAGRRWLAETVDACRNPLAPIVLVADDSMTRSTQAQWYDTAVSPLSPDSLAAAMDSLESLISRVASLPDIPTGPDRSGLITLAMAHTRNQPIEPLLTPYVPHGVDYPLLPAMGNQRRLLEDLAGAGLLRPRFFERLHLCEHCDSARVHAREVCVKCQSSHLVEASIVHHYSCGFQAPQPNFELADGYRCPKCRKELRHYGVDYDKPGTILTCQECENTMAEPEAYFLCFDCNKQTASDRARKVDWHRYDLTPDGLDALRQMKLPRTDDIAETAAGYSPRDFKLLASQHLQLSEQFNRPISFCTLEVDGDQLERQVGPSGAAETLYLLREIASGELRASDFATFLPSRAVVCMPETDQRDAQEQIGRIEKRIKKTLSLDVKMSIQLLGADYARPLLQELH